MTEAWRRWEGRTVARAFQLHEYLGGSDSSAVFLTERQGQRAAIKLVKADAATDDSRLECWRQAAQLEHRHLIRLFEMGRFRIEDTELLFVVEEYAEENLAQVLPQRALTPAEVRELLPPTLDALGYLHNHGFVHGDLKPANIMAADDQLKLSSDGLRRTGELGSGQQAETDVYDPPESASGLISPAEDVWRLGITLCEARTQKLPIRRDGEQNLVLPATIPSEFRGVIENCLRHDPEKRWSIHDVADWLQQPTTAPKAQAPVRAAKAMTPKKRFTRSTVAVLVAVAAVVVLAVFIVGERLIHQSDAQSSLTNASDQPTAEAASAKPAPSKPKASRPTRGHEQLASADNGTPPSSLEPQTTGRGLSQADVVEQVLPEVAQEAKDTIHGRFWVSVRVQVDSSGNVIGAEFASRGPSQFFANAALDAARNWKFAPRTNGQRRQGIVQFQFEHGSIKALPVR